MLLILTGSKFITFYDACQPQGSRLLGEKEEDLEVGETNGQKNQNAGFVGSEQKNTKEMLIQKL